MSNYPHYLVALDDHSEGSAAASVVTAQDENMTIITAEQTYPTGLDLAGVARYLAFRAHRGQVDKQGRDYFDAHLRPIASALAVLGPDAEAVGWLHDIIEDTPVSEYGLLAEGVPVHLIEAVSAVSRIPGETYGALIYRAATASLLSCRVKLVDNTWNILSNTGLSDHDPVRASSLLETRYLPARKVLLAHCGLTASQIADLEAVLHQHLVRLNKKASRS